MRKSWWIAVVLVQLSGCASVQPADPVSRGVDILQYRATIEPDIKAGTLAGTVIIRWRPTPSFSGVLALDRYPRLTIQAVREDGLSVEHIEVDGKFEIRVLPKKRSDEPREIEIDYQSTPGYGMQMHPGYPQIYTLFSTSQWMPVVDAPDERASLELGVRLPPELGFAGNGVEISSAQQPDGKRLHRWKLDREVPSYVYGFAAAPFTETILAGEIGTRLLGVGFTVEELQKIFVNTGDMLDYFASRAGVAYPDTQYTQVLVVETIGQELAGLSFLSEEYGRSVLADPQIQSLIAHEAAHQWWGNSVTCRDWRHFWLNEGFATFLAASYLQKRFGDVAYNEVVDAWAARVANLRLRGSDKPLVFADWHQPSADDRAVVYQKGAYVLHRLREHLGEAVFWRGMRAYTREHFGHSVVTQDFQRAMEKSSGRSLQEFFAHWVYSTQ